MKQYFSKLAVGLTMLVMVMTAVSANSITAEAYSVTNGKMGFKSPWELSVTMDGGKGVLTYGYNTLFINEDYSHAYHSTKSHYAYVKNARGSFSGPNKGKKKWSKIEVTHKGNSITYGISY